MGRKKEVRLPNANRAANEDQNLQNKRLKALYEAIDNGRTKDSIDIADKLIRKFGGKDRGASANDRITVNTAQALKALALIRAENTAEAAPLVDACEQALTGSEFNEGTLQVLFHCFKESYIPNRIPQLIEKILKVQPATEPLLLDLYFGYARVMDFKNQLRVANMLYKENDVLKYLLWAVNSLIMQANASPALAGKMYYPLANRMLEKAAVSGAERKMTRTEIVLNYHILVQLRLYDKTLDHLHRHSNNMNKQDSKLMKFELLKLSEDFDQLLQHLSNEIQLDALSFGNWETLFWIYEKGAQAKDEALQKRSIDTLDLLCRKYLPETDKIHKQYSFLIKLLFLKNLHSLGHLKRMEEVKEKFGTVLDTLKKFTLLTHSRPNCFADISKFLHLLNYNEKSELLAFVEEEFRGQFEAMTDAFLIRELLRTGFGYYRNLPIRDRNAFLVKLVGDLRTHSNENHDLDTHAKAVTLIVANILWETYRETGSNRHLYELATLLEFIFDLCSNVFISAILYIKLGNMNRIVALFNQLDIKYFQRDSLGYLTFASAMQFGRFREAIYYFTSITVQFYQNERETSESIVTANKTCSLDQVPSLVEFSEHCRSSIYALGADVLNQLLSACFAVDHLHFALITLRGDDDRIDWNRVTDSRDFGILQTVSLVDENITAKVKALGFTETLDFIKLLQQLGRVVSDVGVANLPALDFDADLAALRTHLAYCKSAYETSEVVDAFRRNFDPHLQGFGAPQVVSLVSNPFLQPLLHLLSIASKLFGLEEAQPDSFAKLVDIAGELAKDVRFDELTAACQIASIQNISQFLEHGTHCVLVMTLCELLIKFMEARAASLIQKLKPDVTLEKIEKLSVQQQELTEHLQSLRIGEKEETVEEGEDGKQTGKKGKKVVKTRPFEELNDEQKVASSFKFVQKNLLTVCHEFEQKVTEVREHLTPVSPAPAIDFFDGENGEEKIDFKAADLARFVDYVNRLLTDSHTRSLEDLRQFAARVHFFATQPRFSLLNIHFAGSSSSQSQTSANTAKSSSAQ